MGQQLCWETSPDVILRTAYFGS
ncbi:hypothetical protein AG1IA_01004 [Rhizoctonia solani AG-1 IA]|uniref:Uncharacterized protein n=1 Tax=Thanatephorus cucumeris (strain AG1-IA) TaxID=983506 RepID=L8X791_THACA|nr:hypothetical protein AG1IA_01004 [Rhizoctonia solani AG-1 IA]